jgi:SAM-dependent methyltransferase
MVRFPSLGEGAQEAGRAYDARLHAPDPMPAPLPTSPAAERNKGPILAVLQRLLPPAARVLELASGTGQHAAHFAHEQPQWHWQPSDGEAAALPTIARRCAALRNVAPPMHLDLLAGDLNGDGSREPIVASEAFDALYAANLLHISPWPTTAALMRLAAECLRARGRLVVYGPFDVEGEPLAPSNRAFDADLRSRDARWGLRQLGDVQAEAARAGLVFEERVVMPANNLMLVWRREPAAGVRPG